MHAWRNRFISLFVILWLLAFHYASLRYFYLQPLFHRPLPKIKFLFPPAGWIMFYRVDESYGNVRVFGVKGGKTFEIDPHEIFRVRTIGFDNIHRGIMNEAASSRYSRAFCAHLRRRFKGYDRFAVAAQQYPHFITRPDERYEQVLYTCPAEGRTGQ